MNNIEKDYTDEHSNINENNEDTGDYDFLEMIGMLIEQFSYPIIVFITNLSSQ